MEKIRKDEKQRLKNKNKACMIEDHDSMVCIDPSIPLLNLIGKKYTMMVLGVIGNRGNRKNFNEILRDIPYSSSTIISRRLKEIRDLGLIERNKGSEGVSYSLTSFGKSVRESLLPLLRLAEKASLD
ncbi:MAG: helix-turn-helix domain-containing protein [Thermoplasmatales archaeon]